MQVTEHLAVEPLELVPLQVPETSDDTDASFTPLVNCSTLIQLEELFVTACRNLEFDTDTSQFVTSHVCNDGCSTTGVSFCHQKI
jgi:hypothetical protein